MATIERFWDKKDGAIELKHSLGYFLLPTFLPIDDISWKGSSEIVKQFNYTASKNFVLARRPIVPLTALYGLCIKYRVGEVVYRYKLWDHVEFVLNASLYNGERIKKNFCLEIWTYANRFEVYQAKALKLRTLITQSLLDYNSPLEFEDCVGVDAGDITMDISEEFPLDNSNAAWLDNVDDVPTDEVGDEIATGLGAYIRDAGGDIITDAWGNPLREAT